MADIVVRVIGIVEPLSMRIRRDNEQKRIRRRSENSVGMVVKKKRSLNERERERERRGPRHAAVTK